MPRLIWVIAGRTLILLVLSCRGSYLCKLYAALTQSYLTLTIRPQERDSFNYFCDFNHKKTLVFIYGGQESLIAIKLMMYWGKYPIDKNGCFSTVRQKTAKWHVRTTMAQISLGIRLVWSVVAVRMKRPWVLIYQLRANRRLCSDWANAQADQSLYWAHSSVCWFCHAAVQMDVLVLLDSVSVVMIRLRAQCYFSVDLLEICIGHPDRITSVW